MTEGNIVSELVQHIIRGGKILNTEHQEICTFEGFALVGDNDRVNENVSLETLHNEYEIYMTLEQQRIKELEELLRKSGDELQKALAKNKELKPPKRAHLTRKEVIDIEQAFKSGLGIEIVMSANAISYTVARRIQLFKHTHSTPQIDH